MKNINEIINDLPAEDRARVSARGEDLAMDYRVFHGGLMRCCLESLREAMSARTEPPAEGETLPCKYHDEGGGMIFCDGAWRWNRPKDMP